MKRGKNDFSKQILANKSISRYLNKYFFFVEYSIFFDPQRREGVFYEKIFQNDGGGSSDCGCWIWICVLLR